MWLPNQSLSWFSILPKICQVSIKLSKPFLVVDILINISFFVFFQFFQKITILFYNLYDFTDYWSNFSVPDKVGEENINLESKRMNRCHISKLQENCIKINLVSMRNLYFWIMSDNGELLILCKCSKELTQNFHQFFFKNYTLMT